MQPFTQNAAWSPELNYVYCTKKLKPSKTSPGTVQVWTVAKGSVDMVSAGSSISSKQSSEKGLLLVGQDRWGLLCLTPAGSQASARLPAHTCCRPSLPRLPEQQHPGQSPSRGLGWGITGQGRAHGQEVELSTSVTSGHVTSQVDGRRPGLQLRLAGGSSRRGSASTTKKRVRKVW